LLRLVNYLKLLKYEIETHAAHIKLIKPVAAVTQIGLNSISPSYDKYINKRPKVFGGGCTK